MSDHGTLQVNFLPLCAAIRACGHDPIRLDRNGERCEWLFANRPDVVETMRTFMTGELSVNCAKFLAAYDRCRDEVRGRSGL